MKSMAYQKHGSTHLKIYGLKKTMCRLELGVAVTHLPFILPSFFSVKTPNFQPPKTAWKTAPKCKKLH